MRVGLLQFSPCFGRVADNMDYVVAKLSKHLAESHVELVVLPELSLSGYYFLGLDEAMRYAQTVPGPETDALADLASRHECSIVIGIDEKRNDGSVCNSAVLVRPDRSLGMYRKVHLFNDEKLYFSAGADGFPVFELHNRVLVGMLVCFDHLFPEAARSLALQGAQIICHPSALVLPEIGQLTTRVRAIENRIFWILANRCGTESRGAQQSLAFTGSSHIIDPRGAVLAQAAPDGECFACIDIDPAMALNKWVTPRNHAFDDRRTDLYCLDADKQG